MADITAKQVNELRNKTGLGMMECKKALVETGGDIEKAIENIRKSGIKTSITERAANEGRIALAVSADRKRGVIVEVNCTTDFTAKSEVVAKIAELAAQKLIANPSLKLADDSEIKNDLLSAAQQTKENVQIGRIKSLDAGNGTIGSYLYSASGKGKIGVLVAATGKTDDDLLRNLCIHIVASKPIALNRADVPADLVAKEKEIAVEQAKSSGKPQNIAEKIAEGKLNSFYAEKVLLDQEFVQPEYFKGTVGNLLTGKGAVVESFVRLEVGQ